MTAIALAEMPIEKVIDEQIQLLYVSLDAAEVVVWRRGVFMIYHPRGEAVKAVCRGNRDIKTIWYFCNTKYIAC